MHPFVELLNKSEKLIVGLMSGTSVDGIDTALIRVKGNGLSVEWELIAFDIYDYPDVVRQQILDFSQASQWDADEFCRLNVLVGEFFACAVLALCDQKQMQCGQLDLVGSHGQTIRHLPEMVIRHGIPLRTTLQIGEPAVISKRCGVITVADFRPADMALGGQGAPLVPYCDFLLFRSQTKNRCLLNIGGIANFTIFPQKASLSDLFAFDTGPGNMVLDGLMQQLFNKPHDPEGEFARQGKVCFDLLQKWMQFPYFSQKPPKTTGREDFGNRCVASMLFDANRIRMSSHDIMATAVDWVAGTIFTAYQQFVVPLISVDEIIVSGGGVENHWLMQRLRKYFEPIEIILSDAYGVASAAKEAICFALLANETIFGNSNNVPSATGAAHPTILGKICL